MWDHSWDSWNLDQTGSWCNRTMISKTAANLWQNNRKKWGCCIGPVKVQNLHLIKMLWWDVQRDELKHTVCCKPQTEARLKRKSTKIHPQPCERLQKTTNGSHCSWRRFYQVLNLGVDLDFYTQLFHFTFVFVSLIIPWWKLLCGFVLPRLDLNNFVIRRTRWLCYVPIHKTLLLKDDAFAFPFIIATYVFKKQ